jgi:ribosome maturation factor RimP
MLCLICFSSIQWTSAADVRQPGDPVRLRQKVELFGIGADVKVKLADGEKMKGIISSIDEDGFGLASPASGSARQISYNGTSELTLVSKRYHASGTPDASEARRVVAALGVGTHVMVRTGEQKVHGQIRAVDGDHFVILPDDKVDTIVIAYQDVQQIGKNLGILSMIGLVVVVVVVIVVIAKVKG